MWCNMLDIGKTHMMVMTCGSLSNDVRDRCVLDLNVSIMPKPIIYSFVRTFTKIILKKRDIWNWEHKYLIIFEVLHASYSLYKVAKNPRKMTYEKYKFALEKDLFGLWNNLYRFVYVTYHTESLLSFLVLGSSCSWYYLLSSPWDFRN